MRHDDRGYGPLALIAVTKLLKSLALILLAALALRLVHHDVAETLATWIRSVRADPDNRHLHALVTRVAGVSDHQLEAIAFGTLVYATLFAVEGVGLLMREVWAEYLTVFTTGLLLPLEVYEIFHHRTVAKVVILLANAAILVYLIRRLKNGRADRKKAGPAPSVTPA